jgi:hypothetical protein
MITVNLSPLAITPLARREACLAGEDLVEETVTRLDYRLLDK